MIENQSCTSPDGDGLCCEIDPHLDRDHDHVFLTEPLQRCQSQGLLTHVLRMTCDVLVFGEDWVRRKPRKKCSPGDDRLLLVNGVATK